MPLRMPSGIRDLAERLGVSADTGSAFVTLTQSGSMRDPLAGRWMSFNARQTIALDRPGFSWKSRAGPFGCITVVDALAGGEGDVSVKLFDLLPLAHVRGNDEVTRGELLRYLAERPWAPDAIMRNRELSWSIRSDTSFRVTAGNAAVGIALDAEGRIGSVHADRPRKEGADFVTRPWQGGSLNTARSTVDGFPMPGKWAGCWTATYNWPGAES